MQLEITILIEKPFLWLLFYLLLSDNNVSFLIKKFNWDTIDILKIDIEGSEKEIFTNPNSDISFLAITKCIAIEIHDEFNCREAIYEVLKQFNFTFFNSGDLTIGVNQNLIKGRI